MTPRYVVAFVAGLAVAGGIAWYVAIELNNPTQAVLGSAGTLPSTLLGGVLVIAGGYIAVVVGERRRQERERAERLRSLRRAELIDTRDYLLGLLDVQMARALEDAAAETAIAFGPKARAPRINLGLAETDLLIEQRRVTNELMAVDLRRRRGKPPAMRPGLAPDYTELRVRLTGAFAELEQRIERDEEDAVLSREEIRAIEDATPLIDHLALDDL
ncbi:MAG: hypothetical protein LC798_05645 [Chloroflexi bacterium]|nr:hypothetical protein [Chloroflexota bacterium]